MPNESEVKRLSTPDLLAEVVGPHSATVLIEEAGPSLLALLRADALPGRLRRARRAARRLMAARELVLRAAEEELQATDVLTSPTVVRDYLKTRLCGLDREAFMVVFLTMQNHVIAAEELFHGTLGETSVYPRIVVMRALYHNCGSVIFAHNHPSGVAEPSAADRWLTQTLKKALGLVDIRVLDHFVVGGGMAMSFAEAGLL